MALPKRRHSRSRRNKRRATHKLASPLINRCPSCGAVKRSHRICQECGFYRNETFPVKK